MIINTRNTRPIMPCLMAKDANIRELCQHDGHGIKPTPGLYLLGSIAALLAVLPLIALALLPCT